MRGRTHGVLLAGALALGSGLGLMPRPAAPEQPLPAAVALEIDGRPLLRADVVRAWASLDADRRAPASRDAQAFALRRLIEEELLVQSALQDDLLRSDERLRRATLTTMVQIAAATGVPPSAAAEDPAATAFDHYLEDLRRAAVVRVSR